MESQDLVKNKKATKVLIVDDDATIRFMVKSILQAESYSVIEADNGKSAVEIIEQQGFAVDLAFVMLDIMMPGMTGLDVLTRIKLNPSLSAIPVIMLSAENKDKDILSGYEQGAEYYITKPFTRQQLLFGIQTALGGS